MLPCVLCKSLDKFRKHSQIGVVDPTDYSFLSAVAGIGGVRLESITLERKRVYTENKGISALP